MKDKKNKIDICVEGNNIIQKSKEINIENDVCIESTVMFSIFDTTNEDIKNALVKLGWVPPDRKNNINISWSYRSWHNDRGEGYYVTLNGEEVYATKSSRDKDMFIAELKGRLLSNKQK